MTSLKMRGTALHKVRSLAFVLSVKLSFALAVYKSTSARFNWPPRRLCAKSFVFQMKRNISNGRLIHNSLRPNAPAAILSSIESAYLLRNPFPSKPSIVFWPRKPLYSQPNYSSWWLGIFVVLISSNLVNRVPDVNINKGVAEMVTLRISCRPSNNL